MLRGHSSTPRRILILAAALAAGRLLLHLALHRFHGGYTFLMSPTEVERTRVALAFAARPAFAPLGILYWLPLQFWLEGSLLRLWPDALAVPFAVNTAASLLTVSGVVLWTWELTGEESAAAAAGAAVLVSASGIVLGSGGAADALLHASAVWALLFWTRFEKSGRVSQAWLCAVCLALGSAARYEAWLVTGALAAAAALDRRRGALPPLAAACLFPAVWGAYNAAAAGTPWAFAAQTFAAEIRDMSRPRWYLSLSFLADFLDVIPLWLLSLTLGAAFLSKRALPRSYWFTVCAVALFFILTHPFAMSQVDDHLWIVFLLCLPAAGAAAAAWLSGLDVSRRRAAAAAGLALLLASETVHLFAYERYLERFNPLTSVYMRMRSLRRDGTFTPLDAILVEIPEGPHRGLNQYRVWTLEPGMEGLFDRELRLTPDGRSIDAAGNASALGLPRAELNAWLKSRNVRAVVASQHDAQLAGLGWTRAGGPPEAGVWLRAGDAAANRWLP